MIQHGATCLLLNNRANVSICSTHHLMYRKKDFLSFVWLCQLVKGDSNDVKLLAKMLDWWW
jgi:hypothetical protein